jgi:hypothetical protein
MAYGFWLTASSFRRFVPMYIGIRRFVPTYVGIQLGSGWFSFLGASGKLSMQDVPYQSKE